MSRPVKPQRQKTLDEQLAKMLVWDLQPFSRASRPLQRPLIPPTSYQVGGPSPRSWFLNFMPAAVPVSRREWDTLQLWVSQRTAGHPGRPTAICPWHAISWRTMTWAAVSWTVFSSEIDTQLTICLNIYWGSRGSGRSRTGWSPALPMERPTSPWQFRSVDGHTCIVKKLSETVEKVKHVVDHFHRSSWQNA